MSSHHVPERTCVACRQRRAKSELIRIVRTPQGIIEIDEKGKKAGRGAYLCKRQDCWQRMLKSKGLEHVLRTQIIPEQRDNLVTYGKALPKFDNTRQMSHQA